MDHFLLCALTRQLCKALPKDHYLPQQLIDLQITFQTIGTKFCNLLFEISKAYVDVPLNTKIWIVIHKR